MDQDNILIVVLGVGVVFALGVVMYWARGTNADPLIDLLAADAATAAQAQTALEAEKIYSQLKSATDAAVRETEAVITVHASDHARAVVALQDAGILPR